MNKLIALLIILVLLSACNTSPSIIPSPTIKPALLPSATSVIIPTNTEVPTNTPPKENTPTIEPIKESTPTPQSPSVGWGLTQADAARMFQLFQFSFELETNDQGQEVYVGTVSDELATVTITGPEDNISSIAIVIIIPQPPTEDQASRAMVYLATILTVAADDWTDGSDWLNKNFPNIGEYIMGESRTIFDNRDIVLTITPENGQTKVEFIISAK